MRVKARCPGLTDGLTFKDDHQQAHIAQREERLLPDVVENACQRGSKDDTDGDLGCGPRQDIRVNARSTSELELKLWTTD